MLALAITLSIGLQSPTNAVEYGLDYTGEDHVAIELTLPAEAPATAHTLVMPRSIPMGYGEVHYDRFVQDVRAFDADGEPLTVEREPIGPRWRIAAGCHSLRYRVDLDAQERAVLSAADASKVRPDYVGILGYSVFAFVEGLRDRPIELTITAPEDWPVFTTLAPRAPPPLGEVSATTKSFYALADSQIVMGEALQVARFDAAVPLFVAQYAERDSDIEVLGGLAAQALDALVAYFGSTPFTHYTVHAEFLEPRSPDHEYGFSMEHMDSCTLFLAAERAMRPDAADERTRGRDLYNLAHHIAHSWIPKRCAAAGYFPWSWEIAPLLDSIWFSEGWGQYVAAVALEDAGAREAGYREQLVRRRFRIPLRSSPKFLNAMLLAEVSRVASTRYSSDFRTGRNVFARGGLMAFEIDEAIRRGTNGEKSLRDLVRALVDEGASGPLELVRIPSVCRRTCDGIDVNDLFRRWLGPVEPSRSR